MSRPDWRAAAYRFHRLCACGTEFHPPYWSDRNECDTCLLRGPSPQGDSR